MGSGSDKVFSKQAVLPKSSQSTIGQPTVYSRKTFQNTATSRKPFHDSPKSQPSFGHRRGFGNKDKNLCYVCYSPNHLIKDCDLHSKYLSQFPKTKSANPMSKENKQVWNHSNRFNHSNFSKDYGYPHQKRPFSKPPVPSRESFQSTGKSEAVPSQSTAKYPPNQGNVRPRKFNYHQSRRPYTSRRVPTSKNPKHNVKTKWVKKQSTDEGQTVLSESKGEKGCVDENPTKVLDTKTKILDNVFKNSGNYILKEFEYVTPQGEHKSIMVWVPKRN